jgi:recombinational DNA repair protein RecR
MYSWVQKDIVLPTGDGMKIEVEKKYQTLFDTLTEILLQNPNIRIEQLKKKVLTTHSVNEEVIDEIILSSFKRLSNNR